MMLKTLIVAAILFSLFFLFRLMFFSLKTYEEPEYNVLKRHKNIEIRQYQGFSLVSANVSGDKQTALKLGFRRLAAYIFGRNAKHQRMDMTVPVMLESIDTAWRVSFMLPRAYSFSTLPKPDDKTLYLSQLKKQTLAVIRFSGRASSNHFIEKRMILEAFLTKNHCVNQDRVVYAYFNPPWTLPFLRRNEVWIFLTKDCKLMSRSSDQYDAAR